MRVKTWYEQEQDQKAKRRIEAQEGWRKERTEKIHIALANKDLDWIESEVEEFIRLAEEAYHLDQIAAFFKRDMLEVFVLYLDLVDRRKIETKLKVVYTE